MTLDRRDFLCFGASAAAFSALSRTTHAQDYPSRPVRLIVGLAAGGTPDILARLMGQWLSERLGQQVVIENRTGASGNIATESVVNAPADGHTLLLVTTAAAINATLHEKLKYNFIRDIVPVAGIMRSPHIMLVHPSVPARTIPEFIGYAKANPGKLNMASVGIGSGPHMSGELFKMMAGVDMVHVPYRGGSGPALNDLLGGQVQVFFTNTLPDEYVRAGKLRALALTAVIGSKKRLDIPTVGDSLPGYESSAWFGICAPRNTPAGIVDQLNKTINAGLADPKIKARLADYGGVLLVGSPVDFGRLIADETEKWGKVIKFAGIKPS